MFCCLFISLCVVCVCVCMCVCFVLLCLCVGVTNYDSSVYGDAWRFIIAIGVLAWLNAMALIIIYIIRPRIDQHLAYLPVYELAA